MGIEWEREFRQRMVDFVIARPATEQEVPLSIKVRVASGCFHAEDSPEAASSMSTLRDLRSPVSFRSCPRRADRSSLSTLPRVSL